MPSEEALDAAIEFVQQVEKEAAAIDAAAAPNLSEYETLLAHRTKSTALCNQKDTLDGTHSRNSLVRCRRCHNVMYESAINEHFLICKEISPPSTINNSNSACKQTTSKDGSKAISKRKRNEGMPPPPPGRSINHRAIAAVATKPAPSGADNGSSVLQTHFGDYNPPLSPVLAAAAAMKQGRSFGTRKKRKILSFVPGQDISSPLHINAASPSVHQLHQSNSLGSAVPKQHSNVAAAELGLISPSSGVTAAAGQKIANQNRGHLVHSNSNGNIKNNAVALDGSSNNQRAIQGRTIVTTSTFAGTSPVNVTMSAQQLAAISQQQQQQYMAHLQEAIAKNKAYVQQQQSQVVNVRLSNGAITTVPLHQLQAKAHVQQPQQQVMYMPMMQSTQGQMMYQQQQQHGAYTHHLHPTAAVLQSLPQHHHSIGMTTAPSVHLSHPGVIANQGQSVLAHYGTPLSQNMPHSINVTGASLNHGTVHQTFVQPINGMLVPVQQMPTHQKPR